MAGSGMAANATGIQMLGMLVSWRGRRATSAKRLIGAAEARD